MRENYSSKHEIWFRKEEDAMLWDLSKPAQIEQAPSMDGQIRGH